MAEENLLPHGQERYRGLLLTAYKDKLLYQKTKVNHATPHFVWGYLSRQRTVSCGVRTAVKNKNCRKQSLRHNPFSFCWIKLHWHCTNWHLRLIIPSICQRKRESKNFSVIFQKSYFQIDTLHIAARACARSWDCIIADPSIQTRFALNCVSVQWWGDLMTYKESHGRVQFHSILGFV